MARVRRTGMSAVLLPVLALALVAGCGPAERTAGGRALPSARPAAADAAGDRVGALFDGTLDGPRMCTASVVGSPRGNLLLTAAHCVQSLAGGRADGLVFVPGYRDHQAPHGSWPVSAAIVDPHWAAQQDPEYDVAFLTVEDVDGRRIEDVVGANRLATGLGFGLRVSVTGYPNESATPITCEARTTSQSATQERFDCAGYTDGTSGSPWVTRAGQVVGVVGGYQEGGDTPDISYSITFDDRIAGLYREATA